MSMKRLAFCGSSIFATIAGLGYLESNENSSPKLMKLLRRCVGTENSLKFLVTSINLFNFPGLELLSRNYKSLETTVLGRKLSNPIGLAAGFDTNARYLDPLFKLGFGFVEVGTVTTNRVYSKGDENIILLEDDKTFISRYGLTNGGVDLVASNLEEFPRKDKTDFMVGVNLGLDGDASTIYLNCAYSALRAGPYCDYLSINVTPQEFVTENESFEKEKLSKIISSVKETFGIVPEDQRPLFFLKLSPDLSDAKCRDIVNIISNTRTKVDGLIICDSTMENIKTLKIPLNFENGHISGSAVLDKSNEMIEKIYKLTNGSVTIIGVGGISNGQDAYDKIIRGASLVQIYSSLLIDGYGKINQVKRELDDIILRNGFTSVEEAVGSLSKVK